MNNNLNNTPVRDDWKEAPEAVAFTRISDLQGPHNAPTMFGKMTLKEQEECVADLATQLGATLRLILMEIGPDQGDANQRVAWIIESVERYRASFVITPAEAWISRSEDDLRLLRQALSFHDATLITED